MSHYLDTAKFSVDWLNVVLHDNDVKALFDFFESVCPEMAFENWSDTNGCRGYKKMWIFQGSNIIRLAYNPKNDSIFVADDEHPSNKNILLSISGDGCRFMASHGVLSEFFGYCKKVGCHATRLDLALDLIDKENPLVDCITEAFGSAIVRKEDSFAVSSNTWVRSKAVSITENADEWRNLKSYNTTFGNHDSQFGMFRCYDKWLEVKCGRLASCADALFSSIGATDYWYRLEYETHKEHATRFFNMLLNGVELRQVYFEIASSFFRIAYCKLTTSNPHDCSSADVWQDFLDYLDKSYIYPRDMVDDLCALPYIRRTDLLSLRSNIERTEGYIYSVLLLLENDPDLEFRIRTSGKDKFMRPPKAELRRSFAEFGINIA